LEISDIKYDNGNLSGLLDTDWFIPVILTFVVPATNGYELKEVVMGEGQKRFSLNY
jgi:hypothetical protein